VLFVTVLEEHPRKPYPAMETLVKGDPALRWLFPVGDKKLRKVVALCELRDLLTSAENGKAFRELTPKARRLIAADKRRRRERRT
jgi:hypothetical protein